MKIYHMSDTHGDHFRRVMDRGPQDPPDAWIHTGDFFPNSPNYSMDYEGPYQMRWWRNNYESFIRRLKGKPLITVAGNHDWLNLAALCRARGVEAYEANPAGFTFGGLKFAGFREIPYINGRWKGEADRATLKSCTEAVLFADPDVLVTHAPPKGILDGLDCGDHIGNEPLAVALATGSHKIKLHAFGHVHEHGGKMLTKGDILFSNAATRLNVFDL